MLLLLLLSLAQSKLVRRSFRVHDLRDPQFISKILLNQVDGNVQLTPTMDSLYFYALSHSQADLLRNKHSTCQFVRANSLIFERLPPHPQVLTFQVKNPEPEFIYFYVRDCALQQESGFQSVTVEFKGPLNAYFGDQVVQLWVLLLFAAANLLLICVFPRSRFGEAEVAKWAIRMNLVVIGAKALFTVWSQNFYSEPLAFAIVSRLADAFVESVFCYLLVLYSIGWRIRQSNTQIEFHTVGIGLLFFVMLGCYELVSVLIEDEPNAYHQYDTIPGLTYLVIRAFLEFTALIPAVKNAVCTIGPKKGIYWELAVYSLVGLLLGPAAILAFERGVSTKYHLRLVQIFEMCQSWWWGASCVLLYREGSRLSRHSAYAGFNELAEADGP